MPAIPAKTAKNALTKRLLITNHKIMVTASRTIGEILRFLEARAPLGTAEEWDNVGLLAGDVSTPTTGAVISIDLTEEAVQAAIQKKYNLILTHHPCIFPKSRGLNKLVSGTPLYSAIRNGISVGAWHTNFDRCALEVVQKVSMGLGIKPKGRLIENPKDSTELMKSEGLGYGFWGDFPQSKPFSDLSEDVKNLFGIHGFWITSPVPSHVSRVGLVAGKGASFVEAAASLDCDLLITGEAGYHTALGGARLGLAVMELGHRESEKFFIETMKDWLSQIGLECSVISTPTQNIWLGGP